MQPKIKLPYGVSRNSNFYELLSIAKRGLEEVIRDLTDRVNQAQSREEALKILDEFLDFDREKTDEEEEEAYREYLAEKEDFQENEYRSRQEDEQEHDEEYGEG